MGGSNAYCCICGGPTCNDLMMMKGNAKTDVVQAEWTSIPGVTTGDTNWLHFASVAVFADCISRRGTYNWDYTITVEEKEENADEKRESEDPVVVPILSLDSRPGPGEYGVSYMDMDADAALAHETCIHLAAEWSRAENPARYSLDGPADPSRFFWQGTTGHVLGFFCNANGYTEHETTIALAQKSEATKTKLDKIAHVVDLQTFYANFRYGCDDQNGKWLSNCEQEYWHSTSCGITHLKRPDHFPKTHSVEIKTTELHGLFFAAYLPLELVIKIINDAALVGKDIRALECVSRSWRDLFSSSMVQNDYWKQLAIDVGFVPTFADWTHSAEAVRQALAATAQNTDWRRYYNETRKSLNMVNRTRIRKSVRQLDHRLKNCSCLYDAARAERACEKGQDFTP